MAPLFHTLEFVTTLCCLSTLPSALCCLSTLPSALSIVCLLNFPQIAQFFPTEAQTRKIDFR